MRAASTTVRTNIGVLPFSDAQRSHRLSSGSVLEATKEANTEELPRQTEVPCGCCRLAAPLR